MACDRSAPLTFSPRALNSRLLEFGRPGRPYGKVAALGLCLLLLQALVGCGGSAPPTPPAPLSTPGSTVSNSSTPSETEPAVAPKESAATSSPPANQEAQAAASTKAEPAKSAAEASPTKKPAVAEAKPAVITKPTEAQLASWKRANYEKLELLACRDSKEAQIVSHLADLQDGKRFVVAGRKVAIQSIDEKEPELTLIELSGEQTIKSLAVSPDAKWIAAGDSEGMVRIWNAADGKEIVSKKLDTNDITQIAISPDGQELATIGYDVEVSIWNASTLEAKKKFKVSTNGLKRIAYFAAGELAAAGETVSTWNTATGEEMKKLSEGRYNQTLAKTADGAKFVFGEKDRLYFWNVAEAKREISLPGPFASEEHLAFSPAGKWLASANGNGIRIWDLQSRQVVQWIDATGWPIVGIYWLPQSDLLVVASITGRVRIWGTAKAGETAGLKPLHTPVAPLAADSHTPVTAAQFLETIDLRSFPLLPDCEAKIYSPYLLDYSAPVTKADTLAFYRHFLGEAGWKEAAGKSEIPDAVEFTKNGLRLIAMLRSEEAAKTQISINVSDNYDLRWAPKFSGAAIEKGYEAQQTVMYRTKADLLTIETELLRKLHAAGWTAYHRLNASSTEQENARSLDFVQNGVQLLVSIGKFPADPERFAIQTTTTPSLQAIPIPPDCGFVEFDGSTAPLLVANTKLSLAEATDFYDKQLAEEGWLAREVGRSIKEDRCWLTYVRGQCDLMVGLVKLKDGRTLVRVGDGLDNASWQLAKPKKKEESEEAKAGIEAVEFPVLNESKTAKFDSMEKSIEVDMGASTLVAAADKYAKAMKELGWEQDGEGIKDEEYVLLRFKKEKAEIAMRARKSGGKAIFNIQGDGLLWTKELPGGKAVLSYGTWLQTNNKPAGLGLLEEYEKEMRELLATKKK